MIREENERLEAILSADQIWNVLRCMHPTSIETGRHASLLFPEVLEHSWDGCVKTIQNVFRSGLLPRDLNRTFVILIPKVTGAFEFKNLRLISLCHTKILSNRIKSLLEKLVSPNQSAFVPGYWIGENSILANEIVQSMSRKKGIKGIVGLKVDMKKAYNIIDWVVLTQILSLFGFSDGCTKLILNCISSISMELLLNRSVFGKILMERDLRQGDPLSLSLFILIAELLSSMLHKWEREGKFNGVKQGRSSPSISHLFFVDDVLIFYRTNDQEVRNVLHCLHSYCRWMGQEINFEKSGVLFSRNVLGKTKAVIKSCLGMKELDKKTKHLGTSLFMDRNKLASFRRSKMKGGGPNPQVESKVAFPNRKGCAYEACSHLHPGLLNVHMPPSKNVVCLFREDCQSFHLEK